jgi:hypothetical protein
VSLFLSHELNNFSCLFKCFNKWFSIQIKTKDEIYIIKVYWAQTWPWTKRGERGGGGGPAGHEPGHAATQGVPSGPTLPYVVLDRLSSNCIIFAINFIFVVAVCHSHTCFPVYLFCTTCGYKHIPKIERTCNHNKIIITIWHFIHSELIQ